MNFKINKLQIGRMIQNSSTDCRSHITIKIFFTGSYVESIHSGLSLGVNKFFHT
jgi:hypothetical protein